MHRATLARTFIPARQTIPTRQTKVQNEALVDQKYIRLLVNPHTGPSLGFSSETSIQENSLHHTKNKSAFDPIPHIQTPMPKAPKYLRLPIGKIAINPKTKENISRNLLGEENRSS